MRGMSDLGSSAPLRGGGTPETSALRGSPSRTTDAGVSQIDEFGQPRWNEIGFEVLCSRCAYDLRMLTSSRCPECGLEFTWSDVLTAAQTRSRFLFEHNWRERPFRSYLGTVWTSLWPWSFWRRVSIHENVQSGPLWFLLLTAVGWFVVTAHGSAWVVWAIADRFTRQYAVADEFLAWAKWPIESRETYWPVLLVVVAVPMVQLTTLSLLRQTLERGRVRALQLTRVIAYSASPAGIWVGALSLTVPLARSLTPSGLRSDYAFFGALFAVMGGVAAPLGVYVSVGLSRYLRLPRPWALGCVCAFAASLGTITFLWLAVAFYVLVVVFGR